MLMHRYEIQKNCTDEPIYRAGIHIENKLVDTVGERKGGMS